MYRIIVGDTNGTGKALAASSCRISALSSADYCLRDRMELAWGRIAWKGTPKEIRRVFEAERLDMSGLKQLEPDRDYTVLFQGKRNVECA